MHVFSVLPGGLACSQKGNFLSFPLLFLFQASVDLPREARMLLSVQEARKSKSRMTAGSGGDSLLGSHVAIFPSHPHGLDSQDRKPSVSGCLFHNKSPAFLICLPPKGRLFSIPLEVRTQSPAGIEFVAWSSASPARGS